MKNADTPAMPAEVINDDILRTLQDTRESNELSVQAMRKLSSLHGGLTKREHFAGLAMQALLGRPIGGPEGVAQDAVACADALLAELEK